MASEEEYIKKLEEHGLSREEIDRRVKEAISKMKGWIDEKTALFVVAKEEGIEVDSQAKKQSSEQDYLISQLSDSIQNVNVVGRVVGYSNVRSFSRKDGTVGHYSSFILYDGKDQIKVILWDERSKIVNDNAFANDILVRVLNGQVKRNRNNDLEIHIGARGDIELSPTDINPSKFSSIDYSKYEIKISSITPESNFNKEMITVEGMVDQIYSKRTVKSRTTNEDLYVQTILLKDDSGSIPVVFWNKDTKLLDKLQEGAEVIIENVDAKTQYKDPSKYELRYKNGSQFKIKKKGKPAPQIDIAKIDLNQSRVSITGEVALKSDIRTFTHKTDNSEGKFQRITVQDPTGSISIVFWEEDTKKITDIDIGFKIKLENLSVQPDFRDTQKPELIFRSTANIVILSDSSSSTLDKITPISEILEKEGIYSLEGQITQIGDELKSITTSDGRTLQIFSVHLSDNSGAIQLTFWEDNAKKYSDLTVGENIKVSRVSVKKNNRFGINSANFGRSSKLEKDIDFELKEMHEVPDFYSQSETSSDSVTPIQEVLNQEGWFTIQGQITQIGDELKSITTSDGRTLQIFSVHVSDNSGAIQLTFWDQSAEEYSNLSVGENIKIFNVNVKINTRIGTNTASFGRNSRLERDIDFELTDPHDAQGYYSTSSNSNISFQGNYTSISQIEQGDIYEIKGNIKELKRISAYEACAKCLKNISIDQNNCTCEEGPVNSVYRMIISAVINDGTGDLQITFFGDKAEELIRKDAVEIHVKKQDPNYSEYEKEIEDSLKMMDLAVIGQVSLNSYSEEIEMKVSDFKILDLEEDDSIDELIDDIEN